jgi:hypothetical protein
LREPGRGRSRPGGRALLRAWTLTLDEQRPRIADAAGNTSRSQRRRVRVL